MSVNTLHEWLERGCTNHPERVWLRDRHGEQFTEWTWREAQNQINAAAAWLESHYGDQQSSIALLSRNRAHWVMADLAIIRSGNVSIPLFTTLPGETAKYILDFTNVRALILGESTNWDEVEHIVPDTVDIIALPGVTIDRPHLRWDDIVAKFDGSHPQHEATSDELVSIVFTSGTTGVPKGVMQTHDSMLVPMLRARDVFSLRDQCRFLSYLPLAHIAERQLVLVQSLLYGGCITFNEDLPHLVRDMAETRPNYFFGAPRVWEQLQQGILAKFGSQSALDAALKQDAEGTGLAIRTTLGLNDTDFLLTAAAPTPPALIHWYDTLGLAVMEGFGQTEIMVTAVNIANQRKIGAIGKLIPGVEMKITDEGELCFKAAGAAVGYYKMPDKTAETFVDGWVHTGDKGRIDEDGFIFLTGRVKDYFKTIQGKFVAPPPIENQFADNPWTEQVCLLGRGYSKTVMVCVLKPDAQTDKRDEIHRSLMDHTQSVNDAIEKHARIGALIVTTEPWTIENTMLTPTLKIRRQEIETKFGERARELAHNAAVNRTVYVEFDD